MPKLKTKKSVVKKVKVTKNKKVTRRYSKQNHYNSRQTGNFTRKKRQTLELTKTDEANVLKALPYA